MKNQSIVIILLALIASAFSQPGRGKIIQGNKLYDEQKYDEALNKYRDAEVQAPESPILKFNIAAAEYKKKNYEEALKQNQAALNQADAIAQGQAYYNTGNTLFRMNKWPECIEAYKKALELNPDDQDAKYNLEYVRKLMKDQASKQNQQQQQQEQQQQDQQQQDQQQDQQQQQEQQQQQQQQQQEQDQQEQQQQAQEQPVSPDDLSKEDAARILEALKEDPQNLSDNRKLKSSGRMRVEKDW
ncbi:MAG TPA: tetratricopeptide repeat protein [bacterium]|nr:tetratricopeptide repeat protein [bacterium]HPN36363.1 tetratricopeptide repeat protein [bacterium]